MKIQTTPLDDHDYHSLDAMVEFGDLDCGSYLALVLFADRDEIRHLFHCDEDPGWRFRISQRLTAVADRVFVELPIEQQGHLTYAAITHGCRTLRTVANTYADWAITDMCEGGALAPFKRNYKHLYDFRIPNRTKRKLYSRKWIKRYVRSAKETSTLKILFKNIFRRMDSLPFECVVDGEDFIQTSLELQIAALNSRNVRPAAARTITREEKKRRKVLKKSMRAARSLVPASDLTAFIRREDIMVRGQNLILKVKRSRSIMSEGHGVLSVSVHDLEERHLANLCVYFEDTPAVDQLIAMMLYVSSGCEAEFIRAANITYLTGLGKDHPMLKDRVLPPVPHITRRGVSPMHVPYEVIRERFTVYWRDTKHLWISEIASQVLGAKSSDALVDMYT